MADVFQGRVHTSLSLYLCILVASLFIHGCATSSTTQTPPSSTQSQRPVLKPRGGHTWNGAGTYLTNQHKKRSNLTGTGTNPVVPKLDCFDGAFFGSPDLTQPNMTQRRTDTQCWEPSLILEFDTKPKRPDFKPILPEDRTWMQREMRQNIAPPTPLQTP